MESTRHERGCDPPSLQALGMLGGALLVILFVRLLHDPHLPPRLHALVWLTSLVVMARLACHGGQWLVRRSPAALPESHGMLDALAKNVVWVSFGSGLLMAGMATLGMLSRLGAPGRPPGPPPPPPPPPPPGMADMSALFHHGGGPGPGDPGIFLGLALVFVPTALLCMALLPLARKHLQRREFWTSLDADAGRAGRVLALYSLGLLWLLLEPSPDRLKHDLLRLFCPMVLANHAIACAASYGAWRVWFLARRGCRCESPPGGTPGPLSNE